MIRTIRMVILAATLSLPLTALAEAPDFSLKDVDGKTHPLAEYIGNGKWTVLNIWGPRCPPCKEEIPELVFFHEDHEARDAIVLGIALDYPSFGYANAVEVAGFVEEYMVSFPILLSDHTITEQLGAGRLAGVPMTLVYTPKGELVATQLGGITGQLLEDFIANYKPGS